MGTEKQSKKSINLKLKKKNKKKNQKNNNNNNDPVNIIGIELDALTISDQKFNITEDDLYRKEQGFNRIFEEIHQFLQKHDQILHEKTAIKIYCYGTGNFNNSNSANFRQLKFNVQLAKYIENNFMPNKPNKVKIKIYDPCYNNLELDFLKNLDEIFTVLDNNDECRLKMAKNGEEDANINTLNIVIGIHLYCSLYENILSSNESNLQNLILIGNPLEVTKKSCDFGKVSCSKIDELLLANESSDTAFHELPLEPIWKSSNNSSKYDNTFSDTCLTLFT